MSFSVFSNFKRALFSFDLPLVLSSLILVGVGLSTIQSTILAGEGFSSDLFNRQVLALFIGFVLFILISRLNYQYLFYLTPVLYVATIVLLAVLFLVGAQVRGSARWFVIGGFQVQISEYAKIFLIIAWAAFLAWAKQRISQPLFLLAYLALFIGPAVLIYLQPDLGTTAVLAFIWFAMLLFTPIRAKLLAVYSLLLSTAIAPIWFILKDYQKARILAFMNPGYDPLGSGYHILQSIIAVGSGQFLGRGWGRGTQSHLRFLPEQHTDFIFATFAEEAGFLGAFFLFFLFGIILWRGVKVAQASTSLFGVLLAVGVVSFLFIQIVINVAMNLGLAPVTGIPLPLVSYGGSSLIATFIALGVLQSVARLA